MTTQAPSSAPLWPGEPVDPLRPRMLASRRQVDVYEAILTPGCIRAEAARWLDVNDPDEAE